MLHNLDIIIEICNTLLCYPHQSDINFFDICLKATLSKILLGKAKRYVINNRTTIPSPVQYHHDIKAYVRTKQHFNVVNLNYSQICIVWLSIFFIKVSCQHNFKIKTVLYLYKLSDQISLISNQS